MSDLDLSAIDQRVLGSLLEKQRTVPASYPLSLNALRSACNQTSSREPVTTYDDETLTQALRSLKDRDLVRFVWAGSGSRTVKYHQLLSDHLGINDAGLAILTVLLLRGPQSAGQLRTRTERLHPFTDRQQVQDALAQLAEKTLVTPQERRPGQQDQRWIHTLGRISAEDDSGPDLHALESVLEQGSDARDRRVRDLYDTVAPQYHKLFSDELRHKPFDTWLLGRVRDEVGGQALLDVGCGTGHVTEFLSRGGADIVGLDLSEQMIAQARRTYPGLTFRTGNIYNLLKPPAANGWRAITCWYGMVHLAPSELQSAFESFARVLAPGGLVAVALHIGREVRRVEDFLGSQMDVDFVLHDADVVATAATRAGLTVTEWYVRSCGPSEAQTERYNLLATMP